MKRFILYIIELFWREQGRRPNQVHNGLRTPGKEVELGYVLWAGVGTRARVPTCWQGFVCFYSPNYTEGESTLTSLSAFPHMAQRGRGRNEA